VVGLADGARIVVWIFDLKMDEEGFNQQMEDFKIQFADALQGVPPAVFELATYENYQAYASYVSYVWPSGCTPEDLVSLAYLHSEAFGFTIQLIVEGLPPKKRELLQEFIDFFSPLNNNTQ